MNRRLTVMSTLAVEVAFKRTLIPSWIARGFDIDVLWNPTSVLMEQIMKGTRADAVVLIDDSMDELIRGDIVAADTVRPIASAVFGLGVRAGAKAPDISTPDAFVRALCEARAIAYSRSGASGIYFAELIRRLDIADKINERAVIVQAGFTAEKLLTGEADLAVQQISELMSIDGVDVVGPFPGPLQRPTDFSVGILRLANAPDVAGLFVEHLTGTMARRAYEEGGLQARSPSGKRAKDKG
jgi:molybdate transport system substrate-binding protein